MRALTTTSSVVFLVLLFTSSNLTQLAFGSLVGSAEKDNYGRVAAEESMEQRMAWMNHGSSRGPRKHLVNPTVQHPLQTRELPL